MQSGDLIVITNPHIKAGDSKKFYTPFIFLEEVHVALPDVLQARVLHLIETTSNETKQIYLSRLDSVSVISYFKDCV